MDKHLDMIKDKVQYRRAGAKSIFHNDIGLKNWRVYVSQRNLLQFHEGWWGISQLCSSLIKTKATENLLFLRISSFTPMLCHVYIYFTLGLMLEILPTGVNGYNNLFIMKSPN
jgi:hypothetical protein